MKIFVQGLWHCGCVVSACLASLKYNVIAYDDNKKIINELKKNNIPIFEPNLKELIAKSTNAGNLTFVNNLKNLNSANIIWFAYDTPVNEYDQADTQYVLDKIINTLKKLKSNKNVIISSQLPVGSIKFLEKYSKNILKKNFNFFCCPENLRLGNSLISFLRADRIIVGYRNTHSKKKIIRFLKSINTNLLWMKIESAEITKHAINSFLASSITFINEISSICEYTNANAKEVEEGLKSEKRIGRKAFLSPGIPFAGGTLGRDVSYLNEISKKMKLNTKLLSSIRISNENHKEWI
jgi:UDPglucose 6-dehydrogenase